ARVYVYVFVLSLDVKSEENGFVPLLVSLCVGVVEARGLHIQGIYRIPGNRAAVTHLIETVNRGPHAIDLSDARWSDVNVISSLLKQFFQRLPDPLIPSDLYPQFIEASKIEDPQQRLVEIRNLLQDLPDHHYETLKFLCLHLNHVVSNSNDNKMDVRNLAIVFGPTLVRAADDNMAKMVTDMSHQCRIVEMLISHANWFFSEEECDDPPPVVSVAGTHSILSNDMPVSNPAEMEASSQSLLLGNVQKLEASHRDHKKLLVSSIISAANRRVQKARKKMEEDNSSSSNHIQESSALSASYNEMLGHQHEETDMSALPVPQRRVPSVDISHFGNGNRDGRLFEDNCNPLLDRDFEKLDTFSSHHNYGDLSSQQSVSAFPTSKSNIVSAVSTSGNTNTLNTSSLAKSEPLYIGSEDLPIRTYAGLSASTQERIRRFELETRAMLMKKDITKHRREVLDKHKVEEELQKAKKDLETEDIFDKLADNPSRVMHMMNDYCWTPNREAVSLPSLRPSVPSDSFKSHLAKPSFVSPTTGLTNASSKDDRTDYSESGLSLPRTNQEVMEPAEPASVAPIVRASILEAARCLLANIQYAKEAISLMQ
ncbi:Rho GTPase-activating protein 21, partial [Armadillidium vulgare]